MATWYVLQKFKGLSSNGQTYTFGPAELIDDTQVPVTELQGFGLNVVPYSAARLTSVTRYLEQYGPEKDEDQSLLPAFAADGVTLEGGRLDDLEAQYGDAYFVDGSYTGSASTGSQNSPLTTIAAALALAAAGDTIYISPGTYVEDIALAAGVDVVGLCAPGSGRVALTGQLTAAYAGTCNIANLAFTEAGAGDSTIEVTGANATVLNASGCLFTVGAAADYALALNAANAVLTFRDCVFTTITGNANETLQVQAGTLRCFDDCFVTHADGITGPALAMDQDGSGVVVALFDGTRFQGGINVDSAAQNPTNTLTRCRIETGTISAIDTDSTNEFNCRDCELISADAGGIAVDGAGVFIFDGLRLTGTAFGMAAGLNAAAGPGDNIGYDARLTGVLYVDAAYIGAQSDGSKQHPFLAIADALAVAAAGDTIFVTAGAYVEDLGLVDGVRLCGMAGPRGAAPLVTGTATANDVSCVIEDMAFIDDTAGSAIVFTGTAANVLEINRCLVTSTATGGPALDCDNDGGSTIISNDSQYVATTGNANEVVRMQDGTLNAYDCLFQHADNTSESVVHEGDSAGAVNCVSCQFQGQVGSEAAVANPTMGLSQCLITVGAVSAVAIAAGNTVEMHNCRVYSTEAAQDAISGAGTLNVGGELTFTGTADEVATTVTLVHIVNSRVQTGRYTEAAGAGARAIALAQIFPSTSYTVTFGVEDTGAGGQTVSIATGTIATTGFTINTGGNAVFHWRAEHD